MARKLALIIGNSQYEDTGLAKLAAPDVDVRALAEKVHAIGNTLLSTKADTLIQQVRGAGAAARRALRPGGAPSDPGA